MALPILALHCQLGTAFESGPVQLAVQCTAKLRLSRFAAQCRLRTAAQKLREEARDGGKGGKGGDGGKGTMGCPSFFPLNQPEEGTFQKYTDVV